MKPLFLCLCFIIITSTAVRAQDATIATFSLTCREQDFDIWEDDYTGEFVYENSKHQRATMRTVDTLFAYAQQTLARRLGVQLEKKQVEEYSNQESLIGELSGFPKQRAKSVARTGKYNKIIEVYATAAPDQASAVQLVGITKVKYRFEMEILIRVYDKSGNEIAKYRKTTKMEEPKKTREAHGKLNHLSGNEFLMLFASALDNALENKK